MVFGIGAFGAADAPVALQEQPGADGVGPAGDEGEAAVEAVQAVLLDGEGVEVDADAVRLLLPLRNGQAVGQVRLPEGDVTGAADAVDGDEEGAVALELGDLVGV